MLEAEVDSANSSTNISNEQNVLKSTHEWLFGNKNPTASALSELAELILTLSQAGGGEKASGEASVPPLTEADITLIEAFIRKTR